MDRVSAASAGDGSAGAGGNMRGEGVPSIPSDEEVWLALEASNAREFVELLPDGLDTVLGDTGVALSGGQMQRIVIARAIIRRAPVLLLDEAFTGLDPVAEVSVISALLRLVADRPLGQTVVSTLYLEYGVILALASELLARVGRGSG